MTRRSSLANVPERVLRSGETVCATGRYSQEKRALVPDPSATLHAITIRRGEVDKLRLTRALDQPLPQRFGELGSDIIVPPIGGVQLAEQSPGREEGERQQRDDLAAAARFVREVTGVDQVEAYFARQFDTAVRFEAVPL